MSLEPSPTGQSRSPARAEGLAAMPRLCRALAGYLRRFERHRETASGPLRLSIHARAGGLDVAITSPDGAFQDGVWFPAAYERLPLSEVRRAIAEELDRARWRVKLVMVVGEEDREVDRG